MTLFLKFFVACEEFLTDFGGTKKILKKILKIELIENIEFFYGYFQKNEINFLEKRLQLFFRIISGIYF